MSVSESVMMGILAGQMLPYDEKPVNGKWVSEGMQEVLDQWNTLPIQLNHMYWEPPTPILIKAPTGTGKTTFIEQNLTQTAALKGASVLMFVNRTALVKQIINDSCKISLGYYFSPSSLNGIRLVRNLIVLTYQQFAGDYNTVMSSLALPQNIRFVVMDEVHFFAADASFNYQTANIFQNILAYSYNKQRIYMSATPEFVKPIIAYEEYMAHNQYYYNYVYGRAVNDRALLEQAGQDKNNNPITTQEIYATYAAHQAEMERNYRILPKCIYEYNFPSKSYDVNPKFFYSWDTIIDTIKRSDSKEQWLIFVSKDEDGEYLEEKLDGISAFVTARKKGRILERLEQTAKFTQRVLITTSVLDNGINIKNSNLNNVVIDSTDSVQLRQMLGRKRIIDNERVNLYVRNKTISDFDKYCKSIELRIDALNSFERNPGEFIEERYDDYAPEIRKLFPYDRRYNMRFTNKYLRYCLGLKHSEYVDLQIALFEDKYAFAKEVCKWLDITFNEGMIMPDSVFEVAWRQLEPIILAHDEPFDSNELTNVKNSIWEIYKPIARGTGMSFENNGAKANINQNLSLLAQMGFPAYHVKKTDKKFIFLEGLEKEQKSTPPKE